MQSTHVRSMCCCLTIENEARRSDTPSGGVGTALLRIMGLRTLRPNSAFQALTRRDLESWTLVKTAEFCCDLPKMRVAAHCSSISRTFLELFVCPMQGVGTTVAQRWSTCTFSGKYGEMLDISGHDWILNNIEQYWTCQISKLLRCGTWPGTCRLQSRSFAKSTETWNDAVTRCVWCFDNLWQTFLVPYFCHVAGRSDDNTKNLVGRLQIWIQFSENSHKDRCDSVWGTQPSQQKLNFWSTYTNKAHRVGWNGHVRAGFGHSTIPRNVFLSSRFKLLAWLTVSPVSLFYSTDMNRLTIYKTYNVYSIFEDNCT